MKKPFRVAVQGHPAQAEELTRVQVLHSRGLGLPLLQDRPLTNERLAVVGGGPSLAGRLEELLGFDEVWAVNGTARWLRDRGIPAKFFSVDPQPELVDYIRGVPEAVLAACCHASVWPHFERENLRVFDVHDAVGDWLQAEGWSSTVSFGPKLGLHAGYRSVHFFGCDSAFELAVDSISKDYAEIRAGATHVDRNETFHKDQLLINAGGKVYRTNLMMMEQAEALSKLLREFPEYLFNHSGGLLAAMLEDEAWEVTHLSGFLLERMSKRQPQEVIP